MKRILIHKKKIFLVCMIFVVLFVCYLIGQNIVLPSRLKKEGVLTFDDKVPKYSFIQNFESVNYPNVEERDDVPGGFSASYLTLNDNRKVFFFIPGAQISEEIFVEESYKRMSFACGYHPGISEEIADGANVCVTIREANSGKVLFTDKVDVENISSNPNVEIDLTEYKGMSIIIELLCDPGENGDDSGDWIIIKNWTID